MTSLLLVRHAQAPWSTDEMRSLSEDGALVADRLADQLADLAITAVYSSPYTRSMETVAPLATRLDLVVQERPELRERALGAIEPSRPTCPRGADIGPGRMVRSEASAAECHVGTPG